MSKFKVGDKIRHFGSVGTVIEADGTKYKVRYDDLTAIVFESEIVGMDDLEDDRSKQRGLFDQEEFSVDPE